MLAYFTNPPNVYHLLASIMRSCVYENMGQQCIVNYSSNYKYLEYSIGMLMLNDSTHTLCPHPTFENQLNPIRAPVRDIINTIYSKATFICHHNQHFSSHHKVI